MIHLENNSIIPCTNRNKDHFCLDTENWIDIQEEIRKKSFEVKSFDKNIQAVDIWAKDILAKDIFTKS